VHTGIDFVLLAAAHAYQQLGGIFSFCPKKKAAQNGDPRYSFNSRHTSTS
jgi:hypothetical protein